MTLSNEYKEARREFINCICMTIIGFGVPLYLAFKEWWPIMQEEKRKAIEAESQTAAL